VSIFANYYFNAETVIVSRIAHPAGHFAFYFILYAVPYFFAVAANPFGRHIFQSKQFWLLSLFGIAVLAGHVTLQHLPWYLYIHHASVYDVVPQDIRIFATRCLTNSIPLVCMSVPLILYWNRIDRTRMRLYGFDARGIKLRPYLAILLLLLPLILAVSFLPDFQRQYPRFKLGFPTGPTSYSHTSLIGVFELCYGLDFVFVEFFFRGFMVLAFVRLLGPKAILPMAAVYMFFHFEKPILEAISSIFGGLALGIISYRTKSIYGGIILHLGVAMMMEVAGAMQRLNY
jgi:hypothetical protein